MSRSINSISIEDKSILKLLALISVNKLKLIMFVYGIWIIASVKLALANPDKYASHFTDLPIYLKGLPSFVLSLAYLIFFIPVIMLAIAFVVYIFSFVMKDSQKNKV